jgi:phosphocarrier protein HPr
VKNKKIHITNKLGLHARAAAKLVQSASTFNCDVIVRYKGKEVNGKSIMGIMMLAASKGNSIDVITSGTDEDAALNEIESLIVNRFGEDE